MSPSDVASERPDDQVLNLITSPIPKILWHYTDFEGFRGIVSSKSIRATNLKYLNDKEEFEHALLLSKRLLFDLLPLEDADPPVVRPLVIGTFERIFTEGLLSPANLSLFTASFTRHGDQLSQWRGYSKGSTGVSMGLDFDNVRKFTAPASPVVFAPCVYSDEAKDNLLRDLITSYLKPTLKSAMEIADMPTVLRSIEELAGARPDQSKEPQSQTTAWSALERSRSVARQLTPMKMVQISIVRCATIFAALAYFLGGYSRSVSATTLSGFVTSIPGQESFEAGKTKVIMTGNTICYVNRESKGKSGSLLWYSYALQDLLRQERKSGKAVPCRELAAFGSQIDVWGHFTSAETFAAATVVIHRPARPGMLEGAALLEEAASIQPSGSGFTGEAWIDGYPMRIASDSTMLAARAGTGLRYDLHGFWHNLVISAQIRRTATAPPFAIDLLHPGAWTIYHAAATPDGHVTANQIRAWSDQTSPREKQFIQELEPVTTFPDYDRHIDGKVEFAGAPPISIIADREVQEWVSALGESLVPQCWRAAECSLGAGGQLRFLVVRQFSVSLGEDFVVEGPDLPAHQLLRWNRKSGDLYAKPKLGSVVKQVVVVPDGTILVPAGALADLSNKAQLAALLSYAITSVVQQHANHMSDEYLKPEMDSQLNVLAAPYEIWEFEQVVRLGIRQMYLAGFDIREAPIAMTAASDTPAWNPRVDLKIWTSQYSMYGLAARGWPDEVPLFPAYAFNYISQYYSDVDYTKLKRGEAEYAQFLDELRKADPEAFEEKK